MITIYLYKKIKKELILLSYSESHIILQSSINWCTSRFKYLIAKWIELFKMIINARIILNNIHSLDYIMSSCKIFVSPRTHFYRDFFKYQIFINNKLNDANIDQETLKILYIYK